MSVLLSDVVAQVESSGSMLAMRYEPDWLTTASDMQAVQSRASGGGFMDLKTARMLASTSWGRYQIMGSNLWGKLCNYQGTLAEYLTDGASQLLTFKSFIGQIGFSDQPFNALSEDQLLSFARAYNGNGPAYSRALQDAYYRLPNS